MTGTVPYPRARAIGAGLLLAAAAAVLPAPAQAEQLGRSVRATGGEVAFTVRFRDAERETRVLEFALPAARYESARQGLTPVDAPAVRARMDAPLEAFVDDSWRRWEEAMAVRLEALAGTLPDGIALSWSFEGRKLTWSLKGRGVGRAELEREGARLSRRLKRASHRLNGERQRELDAYARRVRDSVLGELNYVRDPALGGLLRPDYAGLARAQADLLRPLSKAVVRSARASVRDRVALALAFVQTIPYDALELRGARGGTGFAVPAELLHLNRGDCDSKATALAAVMRTLVPGVRTAVVLLPGHAVLAADLPRAPGDRTIALDGRRFVLMEPAGPAVLPLGRVGPDSRRLLDSGDGRSVVWITGGPGD